MKKTTPPTVPDLSGAHFHGGAPGHRLDSAAVLREAPAPELSGKRGRLGVLGVEVGLNGFFCSCFFCGLGRVGGCRVVDGCRFLLFMVCVLIST